MIVHCMIFVTQFYVSPVTSPWYSSSSSSCSVLLMRVGCNGPPFLAVLCLSDCLVVLQSCPFSDVCCPLRSRSSASSRAVHFSIQNCAVQCVSILVDDVPKILKFFLFVWCCIIFSWFWLFLKLLRLKPSPSTIFSAFSDNTTFQRQLALTTRKWRIHATTTDGIRITPNHAKWRDGHP